VVETKSSDTSEAGADRTAGSLPPLPPDALIIVPVRSTVLFPGIMLPITAARARSPPPNRPCATSARSES
jgi:ATP-dependent Lon protease